MKTKLLTLFAFAAVMVVCAPHILADPITFASGSISVSDGTITRIGDTSDYWSNMTVDWSVEIDGDLFIYTYVFNNGRTDDRASISHVSVEVSSNFTKDNIFAGTTGYEDGTGDKPNPQKDGISPSGIDGLLDEYLFGLQWNVNDNSYIATIVSDKVPVWGDLFIKGGRGDGIIQAVNSGYFEPDPMPFVPPSSLGFFTWDEPITGYNWVAVPDSAVVPEPSALLLLGTGLGALGLVSYRRKRR